jgi:hypothetical protein
MSKLLKCQCVRPLLHPHFLFAGLQLEDGPSRAIWRFGRIYPSSCLATVRMLTQMRTQAATAGASCVQLSVGAVVSQTVVLQALKTLQVGWCCRFGDVFASHSFMHRFLLEYGLTQAYAIRTASAAMVVCVRVCAITNAQGKNYMPDCKNITPFSDHGSRPQRHTRPCRAEHDLVYT